jgi:hypothetical protein
MAPSVARRKHYAMVLDRAMLNGFTLAELARK